MRRKRIALFVCPSGNLGDSIHAAGVKYILQQVFPVKNYSYHDIMQGRNYYNYDILRSDYDYIVIGGSPYLYEGFYETYKYGCEMRDLLKQNKRAVKILCGVGSCFFENCTIRDIIARDSKFVPELRKFYEDFDLLIVRDFLAKEIFEEMIGKEAHCLPCPSMFVFKRYSNIKVRKKRRLPLLIFNDSRGMLPKGTTDEKRRWVWELQKSIIERLVQFRVGLVFWIDFGSINHLIGIANRSTTKPTVKKIRKIMKFNSPLDLFDELGRAKYVVTSRLHSAIPSSLLGLPTYLIPLDTRAYCAEFFNIKVIHSVEDIKPYSSKDVAVDEYAQRYVSLLEKFK